MHTAEHIALIILRRREHSRVMTYVGFATLACDATTSNASNFFSLQHSWAKYADLAGIANRASATD